MPPAGVGPNFAAFPRSARPCPAPRLKAGPSAPPPPGPPLSRHRPEERGGEGRPRPPRQVPRGGMEGWRDGGGGSLGWGQNPRVSRAGQGREGGRKGKEGTRSSLGRKSQKAAAPPLGRGKSFSGTTWLSPAGLGGFFSEAPPALLHGWAERDSRSSFLPGSGTGSPRVNGSPSSQARRQKFFAARNKVGRIKTLNKCRGMFFAAWLLLRGGYACDSYFKNE